MITLLSTDSRIDEIYRTGKGQTWYLFANAVASFSSYNRYYGISTGALEIIVERKIDLGKPVSRRSLFDIRDSNGEKILTYEHLCPATYMIEILLSSVKSIIEEYRGKDSNELENKIRLCIKERMIKYGMVAVITKKEDSQLNGFLKYKLRTNQARPIDQMKERYKEAGIELASKYITVYGKMYR